MLARGFSRRPTARSTLAALQPSGTGLDPGHQHARPSSAPRPAARRCARRSAKLAAKSKKEGKAEPQQDRLPRRSARGRGSSSRSASAARPGRSPAVGRLPRKRPMAPRLPRSGRQRRPGDPACRRRLAPGKAARPTMRRAAADMAAGLPPPMAPSLMAQGDAAACAMSGFSDPGLGADRLSRRRQDDAAQPAAEGSGARRHGRHHQRVRRRGDRPSAGRAILRRRHPAVRRLPVLHGARRTGRHARRSRRPAADRPHRRAEARRSSRRPGLPIRRRCCSRSWRHPALVQAFRLDGVITLVDAVNGEATLDAPCRGGQAGRRRRPHRARQGRSRRPSATLSRRCETGSAQTQPDGAAHRRARARGRLLRRCSTAGSTIPSTKTADVRRWLGEEAAHAHHHHDMTHARPRP